MYILALNGSPNEKGNTYEILNEIINTCKQKEGVNGEIISILKALKSCTQPFCVACSSPCSGACYKGTLVEEAFKKMEKADVIIIGSPVYFGTISAQAKAFFDKSRRIRSSKVLIGKPVLGVSVGASKYGGQETTLKAIHDIALVEGMSIIGDGHIDFDAGHHGVSSQRPFCEDDNAKARAVIAANRILSYGN